MSALTLGSLALLITASSAQQGLYEQCGGEGWTGATSCTSGSACVSQNAYYSQCIPSTSSATTLTTAVSSSSSSSQAASTLSSSSSSATTLTTAISSSSSSSQASSTLSSTVKIIDSSTSATATAASSTTSASSSSSSSSSGTEYLITFGDSYSQTGFDINGTLPTCANPLGNPTFPGYTTDNGANWIGYLVSDYNTTCILSYNFASGGATVDSSLVAPYATTVLSFVQQVQEFTSSIASHPSTTPWTSSDTLFGIWFGINDLGDTWYNDNSTETTLLNEIYDQYFAQVQILYDAGGRNFVFLTVPPINLTPNFIAQGTSAQSGLASVITVWNDELSTRVSNFTTTNTGVTAKVVDTQPIFNTILAENSTAAACYNADGVSCDWWNDYHPGMKIQEAVAVAVADAESGLFF